MIDSYTQIAGVTASHRTGWIGYDGTNTCTVDGLVGQADSPPAPTFPGATDISDTTGEKWCNAKDYRDPAYGTAAKPFTPGCLYYSQKVGGGPAATPKNPDLFKGLNFTVTNTAGIYSVKVEIGAKCSKSYTFTNDKNTVLVNPTTGG